MKKQTRKTNKPVNKAVVRQLLTDNELIAIFTVGALLFTALTWLVIKVLWA